MTKIDKASPTTLKPWPYTPAEDAKALDKLAQGIDEIEEPEPFCEFTGPMQ